MVYWTTQFDVPVVHGRCLRGIQLPYEPRYTLLSDMMSVQRNHKRIKVDWQFSINKARDKFSRIYLKHS